MRLITATKSPKKCNGIWGCGEPIFRGFEYAKLRGGKCLCKPCRDKIEAESEDNKFWRLLINRVRG